MKCPNCGQEMTIGKVKSRREIVWMDNESDMEIRVSSELQWSWCTANAERCEKCKITVVRDN